MSIFKRIRQLFCKHKYKKHYSTEKKGYEYRCVKCDKIDCRGGE